MEWNCRLSDDLYKAFYTILPKNIFLGFKIPVLYKKSKAEQNIAGYFLNDILIFENIYFYFF